jgi:hypothetical protein
MGRSIATRILVPLVLLVSPLPSFAQAPSVKEQLQAQYPPSTVLIIKKEGILAVAPSDRLCVSRFMHGVPKIPDPSCVATNSGVRALAVGERVHASEIQVDVNQEKIWMWVVECDSCNSGFVSSSYKAQIEFQLGSTRFLEKGNVTGIEDEIGKVLTIDDSPPPAPPDRSAAAAGETLTNLDVVKMVKAKLGEDIIISAINSSASNFDVSVNGMVQLKESGVSDLIIKSMRDAQAAANAPANDQGAAPASDTQPPQTTGPPPVPGQLNFSFKHRHYSFSNNGHNNYLCPGTISVLPDGTIGFDCAQADDPTGQGEHISLPPGSLKEAKIGALGNLHLASKTQGKFDFFGDRNDINQVLAKIAPLVQK